MKCIYTNTLHKLATYRHTKNIQSCYTNYRPIDIPKHKMHLHNLPTYRHQNMKRIYTNPVTQTTKLPIDIPKHKMHLHKPCYTNYLQQTVPLLCLTSILLPVWLGRPYKEYKNSSQHSYPGHWGTQSHHHEKVTAHGGTSL